MHVKVYELMLRKHMCKHFASTLKFSKLQIMYYVQQWNKDLVLDRSRNHTNLNWTCIFTVLPEAILFR